MIFSFEKPLEVNRSIDFSAKSTSSITLADSDAILVIDGTTTKQIPASDLETYLEASLDTLTSVTAVGTLTGLTTGTILPSSAAAIDIGSTTLEFNDAFIEYHIKGFPLISIIFFLGTPLLPPLANITDTIFTI